MGTFPDYGPLLYFLKCDFCFCHLIYWVTDFFDIVLLLLIIKYLHLVSSKHLAIVPVCPYIHICFPFSNHIISQLHIAYKSTFTIMKKIFYKFYWKHHLRLYAWKSPWWIPGSLTQDIPFYRNALEAWLIPSGCRTAATERRNASRMESQYNSFNFSQSISFDAIPQIDVKGFLILGQGQDMRLDFPGLRVALR